MIFIPKESFILELKLLTNTNEFNILQKRFNISEHIYNTTLKYAKKQLKQMRLNKTYRKVLSNYIKNKTNDKKEIYKTELDIIRKSYHLTEYDLHSFVKIQQHKYKKHIDSNTSQKIASTVWKAIENVLFKNGKKLHFKKYGGLTSIEGKTNKSGIKFNFINKKYQLEWNGLNIPVKIRKNDLFVWESLLNNRIKYCRITRKSFQNGYKYFIQLVMDGTPPNKRINKTGMFRCKSYPNKRVGLDIGPSTLAICSNNKAELIELAPDSINYDKKIKRLKRKLDRSRRANNPDNYNKDGTINKTKKLNWVRSKIYIKTLFKLKNLYRLKAVYIKLSHNKLANHILTLGNEVYVEKMSFNGLQKRSKKTSKTKKGKYKSKKRFGKSISNKSPSMLLTIINKKLNYKGLSLNKVNTSKFKASQYNHILDINIKKKLSQRWNKIGQDFIQRDLYSAFLLMNSQQNLEHTNRNLCIKEYDQFKINHEKCIKELSNQVNLKLPNSFGIKKDHLTNKWSK